MPALSKEEEAFYRQLKERTRAEIEHIDKAIEEELARVKQRLAELQQKKRAAIQIYNGACAMLGEISEFEEEEESEEVTA